MTQTIGLGRDDAWLMTPAYALPEHAFTAGAAGDGATQTSAVLDLQDGFGTKRFTSLTALVAASAMLAANKTLLVTAQFETSADAVDWAAVADSAPVLTLDGGAAGGARTGASKLGLNLVEQGERYVRLKLTGDLSAVDTDTAKISALFVLTGADTLP